MTWTGICLVRVFVLQAHSDTAQPSIPGSLISRMIPTGQVLAGQLQARFSRSCGKTLEALSRGTYHVKDPCELRVVFYDQQNVCHRFRPMPFAVIFDLLHDHGLPMLFREPTSGSAALCGMRYGQRGGFESKEAVRSAFPIRPEGRG